jgi:hypothetical protein
MRVPTFTALAACIIVVVSCEKNGDDEGACGAGKAYDYEVYNKLSQLPFIPYTGTINSGRTYFHYLPGPPSKVLFFVGFNAKPVCTNEHMQIDYEIRMTQEPQPLSMRIYGDAYWSAFSDEVILFDGTPTPGQTYKGSLKVGLKQAFPQGGGDVDAFINVEFTSKGSLPQDSAYFDVHVDHMKVSSTYSKF